MSALPAITALFGTFAAAVIDARTGYIPDRITCTTTLLALALAASSGAAADAFTGACAVGGSLLALHLFSRGRGLGLGDVKLGTTIGAGFGVTAGVAALGVAFIAGGAYAIWLLATHRATRRSAIPFGPFLAAGTLTAAILVLRAPQ